MAKNTNSNTFRKIDVDQFNEDNFKEEDGPSTPIGNSVGGIEAEVSNLLSNAQHSEALKMCLANAPIGNKNQEEKDFAASLVMKVLLSTKQNQVDAIVKTLDNDQKDLLMKYIYRGFESPSEGSSAQLLFWHEKVFETAGVGSIVRVMTDRKKV